MRAVVIETGPAPGAGNQGGEVRPTQAPGHEALDEAAIVRTQESARRANRKNDLQQRASNGGTVAQKKLYDENRKRRLVDYNTHLRIIKACVVRLPADYYGSIEGFWNAPPAKQHFDEDHVFTLYPEKGTGSLAEQHAFARKFEQMADEYVTSVRTETAQNLRGIVRGDREVEPGAFDEQTSPNLAMKVIARTEPFLSGLPTLDFLYTSGQSDQDTADHQNKYGIFVDSTSAEMWSRHALERDNT